MSIANRRAKFVKDFKAIRIKRRLTQQQVADDLGFTHAYYNEIENCKRNITIDTLAKIYDYFGIKLMVVNR